MVWITLIGIYIYVITILTQYGWNTYYNIPSNFIDASITANTTYLYVLITAIINEFGAHPYLYSGILFVIVLIIIITNYYKKFGYFLITVLALALAYGFFNFGLNLGKINEHFSVIDQPCLPQATSTRYISPTTYQDKIILIPIDQDNKMKGGFLVKDLSQISCLTKDAYIGQVKP